jgi:hypothetical protein
MKHFPKIGTEIIGALSEGKSQSQAKVPDHKINQFSWNFIEKISFRHLKQVSPPILLIKTTLQRLEALTKQ